MELKTLENILAATSTYKDDQNIRFKYNGKVVGAGYHVTELKLADFTGIDCGRNIETWKESSLQLLEGFGSECMKLGKFRAILKQSNKSIQGLAQADLFVEFGPGNNELRKLSISTLSSDDENIFLGLLDEKAVCKPSRPTMPAHSTVSCCGTSALTSRCCA